MDLNKGIMFAQGTLDELRGQVGDCYKLKIKADMTPVNREYQRIDDKIFVLDVNTDSEVAQILKIKEVIMGT